MLRVKPLQTGKIGVFAHKVRCGQCGYGLRISKNRGRYYLQCSTRHVSKESCPGAFIAVERLEKMVLSEIRRLNEQTSEQDVLEQTNAFFNRLQEQKKCVLSDLAGYQRKIDECAQGKRALYMDKMKGILDDSDFVELSKELTTEKERLEREISRAEKQLVEIEEKRAARNNR